MSIIGKFRDDRGKYPIKIIPRNEEYYVYYEDKLYANGEWDFIKSKVEELKTYYDVGIYLEGALPESRITISDGYIK